MQARACILNTCPHITHRHASRLCNHTIRIMDSLCLSNLERYCSMTIQLICTFGTDIHTIFSLQNCLALNPQPWILAICSTLSTGCYAARHSWLYCRCCIFKGISQVGYNMPQEDSGNEMASVVWR